MPVSLLTSKIRITRIESIGLVLFFGGKEV
jgi:hypothetical protein